MSTALDELRFHRTSKALEAYKENQGLEENLIDLITDAMHFANAHDFNSLSIVGLAVDNFEEEMDRRGYELIKSYVYKQLVKGG